MDTEQWPAQQPFFSPFSSFFFSVEERNGYKMFGGEKMKTPVQDAPQSHNSEALQNLQRCLIDDLGETHPCRVVQDLSGMSKMQV